VEAVTAMTNPPIVRAYRPDRMPTSPAQAAANRARLLAALREGAAA
jgi:hypothetical protein